MNRTLLRAGATLAVLTTALLIASVAQPSHRSIFAGVYLLVLGAIAVAATAGSLRRLLPEPWRRSPFEHRPEPPRRPESIDELERIDRLVVLGSADAFDLHYRLRPLVRQLAAERLAATHAIELDREPERARPHLGDELWELVRPDREPGPRRARGLPLPVLAKVVDQLEEL
jgi:hypothetical protein